MGETEGQIVGSRSRKSRSGGADGEKGGGAAVEDGRPQVLTWLRAESSAESNRQPTGKPKVAADQIIGRLRLRARLCMELEQREMMGYNLQSIGRPEMVLTVTSKPRAKEIVM